MFARLPNIVGSSATPIYWHFKSINSLTEKLHSRFSRHFKVPKVFKFSDGKTASYTLAAGFGTPVQLLTHEIMFVASKFAAYVNSADHPPSPLPPLTLILLQCCISGGGTDRCPGGETGQYKRKYLHWKIFPSSLFLGLEIRQSVEGRREWGGLN